VGKKTEVGEFITDPKIMTLETKDKGIIDDDVMGNKRKGWGRK